MPRQNCRTSKDWGAYKRVQGSRYYAQAEMATEVLGRLGWGREGKKRVSKGRTGRSGHMDQVNGPRETAGWRNTTGGGVGVCSEPFLHLGHGDRECQTGTVRYPGGWAANCCSWGLPPPRPQNPAEPGRGGPGQNQHLVFQPIGLSVRPRGDVDPPVSMRKSPETRFLVRNIESFGIRAGRILCFP